MNSFGPMIEVPGLMRNKGCTGASLPSFAAKALKLFHSAIILDGTHGANRVTAADSMVIPVACGEPKKSPSYSTIRSSSNMPNPTRPSLQRKRAHRIGSFMLQNRLEQLAHLGRIPGDLDAASLHHRQFLLRRALAARCMPVTSFTLVRCARESPAHVNAVKYMPALAGANRYRGPCNCGFESSRLFPRSLVNACTVSKCGVGVSVKRASSTTEPSRA